MTEEELKEHICREVERQRSEEHMRGVLAREKDHNIQARIWTWVIAVWLVFFVVWGILTYFFPALRD